ncbi:MAG TPA: PH domain-containing protein [Anaerolineaceae bacterium]
MNDQYIHSLLGTREKIILTTRQHWFVLASAILLETVFCIVVLLAAIGLAIWLANPAFLFGLFLLLIPVTSMLRDILIWANRVYIVTNLRVMQVAGVFNKSVTDSSLEKVNDVKMIQSFLGRMFNYGDVEILTASELGVNTFHKIGDPVHFKTGMLNAKVALEQQGVSLVPAAGSGDDIPGLIAKLDELHQKGILSEAEFQAKKTMLLAKLR